MLAAMHRLFKVGWLAAYPTATVHGWQAADRNYPEGRKEGSNVATNPGRDAPPPPPPPRPPPPPPPPPPRPPPPPPAPLDKGHRTGDFIEPIWKVPPPPPPPERK